MFLFLKLLKPFLLPPTLIALGMIAAIVALRKRKYRLVTMALAVTLGAYYLLSIEPVAYALVWTLERQYRDSPTAITVPQSLETSAAIVVLAGGATERDVHRPIGELSGDAWRRLWRGITAYHALRGAVPVIYSGGSGDPFQTYSSEGAIAQEVAVRAGVPRDAFMVEDASRTTYENGLAVRAILERMEDAEGKPVLLVTSARHLPRAMGVFAALGMHAIPLPAGIEAGSLDLDPLSFFPSATAFASSVASIHEWVGMVGYRVMGKM